MNTNSSTDTTVADTIAQQMGGVRRIRTMLGATKVYAAGQALTIKWPNRQRSKGNKVVVTLMPSDTYQVQFFNSTMGSDKLVKSYDDVYCDQLVSVFEKQTGWYLHI